MKTLIPRISDEIRSELEFVIDCFDTYDEVEQNASQEDLEWMQRFSLAVCTIQQDKELSDDEKKILAEELNSWADKDVFREEPYKTALLEALAFVDGLDKWEEGTVRLGRKPKFAMVNGVKYVVW